MTKDIGPQYKRDPQFKAAARLHQSKYRANVLNVDYVDYGNRLTDVDGRALLNYYDSLGVREALRVRWPHYSRQRDADLLRSEHIAFNMFAPLANRPQVMQSLLRDAFGLELNEPFRMMFEWAPSPSRTYLYDKTSFDVYIRGENAGGKQVGVGIEVKYTESGYWLKGREKNRVLSEDSEYWVTTRESGVFVDPENSELAGSDLRQIWRNHLLGLKMVMQNDIAEFVSVTLYPEGNTHFAKALCKYKSHLIEDSKECVRGCTFEHFVDSLCGSTEIEAWRSYLKTRYLF